MATVALTPDLHRLLSERATTQKQRIQILFRELLATGLAVAQARRVAGESLSEHYLTDPRLASPGRGSPTVPADDGQLAQLDDLLAVCRAELDANIPRGQLLQALLWEALDPLPPDAPRAPLPTPSRHPHVTVVIPAALNTAVRELALRRGQGVEAVVAELLHQGLHGGDPVALAQDDRITTSDGRGSSTVHVPRTLDPKLTALAREIFNGVKSRAVQALLWQGLDQAAHEASATDRVLTLDGLLYAAVEQHLRARRSEGDLRSVSAFVEDAVRALLEQEQRERDRHG